MDKMLIQLVDGGIFDIDTDEYYYGGCPTCDYGSEYINEIDISMTKSNLHIVTNQMYEYAMSQADLMHIILPEIDMIKAMTEDQFTDWLKDKIVATGAMDSFIVTPR